MTAKRIQEQIEAIQRVTAEVSVSREAASNFLVRAGILSESDGVVVSRSRTSGQLVTRKAANPETQTRAAKSVVASSGNGQRKTK